MTHPVTRTFSGDDPLRAELERAIGFQYEIIRLLGRGGMGAVYHAHEKALDRPVAIKVLPPDLALGADARERFLREARTAARLTHPNIVPLLTFGETQGLIYFVMGYVDGESLEQRLRRGGRLDPDDALRILDQMAGALDYAHQLGVVHRDVKPDNIVIDRATGVAKLMDFGIAKRAAGGETLTGTGNIVGTPRYMSPEQASGDRDLDARSDIYSLGLVGYAMLTGRPPFDGGSVQEILAQQVTRDAPSLRALLPDLTSALTVPVERALKKDPAQRWQTAGAMASALREEEGSDLGGSARSMRKPGTYAIVNGITVLVMADLAWWSAVSGSALFAYATALVLVGPALDYATLRFKDKRSPTEIRRIFTEPPQWWPWWWPERWRRADDVWRRLPRALRLVRLSTTVGIAGFAVALQAFFMAFTLIASLPTRSPLGIALLGVGVAALPVALFGLIAAAVGGLRWGRKQGLTTEQADHIGSAPTGRARFWKQPWVARFLKPADQSLVIPEPQTAKALADAIAAAARQLPSAQLGIAGGAGDAAQNSPRPSARSMPKWRS